MEPKTKNKIFKKALVFLDSMPKKWSQKCLLTGGSAAFLYGSDRPFSDDIDFMVPKNGISGLEKKLNIKFSFRKHKSIFHSLAASVLKNKISYDLVAESIVKPQSANHKYGFFLSPDIFRRKTGFIRGNQTLNCIPKELLVLIKLLAGRGKALGKYDIYDAQKILEKNKDFDFKFFGQLIQNYCKPAKTAIVILRQHAKTLGKSKNVRAFLSYLNSLQ